MKNINIDKKNDTPLVDFNSETGILKISGDSYPEFPGNFFSPLIKWLEEYIAMTPKIIEFHLHLPYFNTSSSKCIMDILELLEDHSTNNGNVKVIWEYDEGDEDSLETGEDFNEDIEIDFEFREIKE